MATKTHAFTFKYPGISRVLETDIFISVAFDPTATKDFPKSTKFKAIWDTGATNSVISQNVIDQCGLVGTGMTKVDGVGGIHNSETYFVNFYLPSNVGVPLLKVTKGELKGFDALIGMDIIGLGDFAVTNKDSKTVFSFRYPSIECIDFVEQVNHPNTLQQKPKQPKNQPCSCGSGQKYRYCCGKKA